jgi:hypothetical protein
LEAYILKYLYSPDTEVDATVLHEK